MMENNDTMSAEALLIEYQKTKSPALLDTLTRRHLYIADIVARRFSRRGVEYDDLYQVASLALIKAIGRFDPDKGVKFVTYATPTMMGEVKNYFRDKSRIIQLPRRATTLNRRLEEAREALEQTLERPPTPTELAEACDLPLETVLETLEIRSAMTVASLEAAPSDAEDASPLSAFLGENDEGYADFERRDQIERAMAVLPENERRVVAERFFAGKSQREVAEGMAVSQMTVSRLERRALERIRAYLEDKQGDA